MTGIALKFDATNAEANRVLDPIPGGWYNCRITETSQEPTSKGDGHYLKVTSEVIDGPFQGRKLFDQLNLWNPNPTAVEIAYKSLAAIQQSTGVLNMEHTDQLLNIPLKVKVKLKPARVADDGKTYDAGNDVKGYDHINSAHEVVSAPAGGIAGAPTGAPPWAAPGAAAPAAPAPAAAPAWTPPAAAPAAPVPAAAAWAPPAAAQPWTPPAPPAPPAPAAPPANPLAAAVADGWQPHPAAPGFHWRGTDVVADADLATHYAPAASAPAAPAAPPAASAPPAGGVQTPPWAR